MASKVFQTKQVPGAVDTKNEAGGAAYKFSPKHALAQFSSTGCFNGTYYSSAKDQLLAVKDLISKVDLEFIAKTAVYARNRAYMKDVPAFLCAHLAALSSRGDVKARELLRVIFPKVINNGRMIRNFVQMMRSGELGVKSIGHVGKRLIQDWLNNVPAQVLFRASIGASPSIADIIKMTHPKPDGLQRSAIFAYLLGTDQRKGHPEGELPDFIRSWEAFKNGESAEIPDVDFRMLSSLDLNEGHWKQILSNAIKNRHWTMVRMNLNTFMRHGCFDDERIVGNVAELLADEKIIQKSRAFPYQLLMALKAATEVPSKIRQALERALEISVSNIPEIDGNVFVCPDVSGSMAWSSATGHIQGATSVARCVDIAALVSCAILRRNPNTIVLPFDTEVRKTEIDPSGLISENAEKLASINGGGTNVSAPLFHIAENVDERVDLVVIVSDNESWIDTNQDRAWSHSTKTMEAWTLIKRKSPGAKLVCIDIQPHDSTQASERADILNVGGFSDQVFDTIKAFCEESGADHWVDVIESTDLNEK